MKAGRRPRRSIPGIGVRTSNVPEAECAKALEAEGWEVMKRGWPDFLAVKDGKVRMIEVKPRADRKLSPAQARVAEVLALLGVTVELWSPSGEEGQV